MQGRYRLFNQQSSVFTYCFVGFSSSVELSVLSEFNKDISVIDFCFPSFLGIIVMEGESDFQMLLIWMLQILITIIGPLLMRLSRENI